MRTFLFFNTRNFITRVFFINDVEQEKYKVKRSKTLYFRAEELISDLIPVIFAIFISGTCLVQTAIAAIDDTVPTEQPAQTIYTEKQLQDLMGPSVVRIIQHIEGGAQIAPIIINIKDRTISLDKTSDPIVFEDLSENIIGSGFIISPDGHILTNAHFVSDLTSKLAIITPYVKVVVQDAEDATDKSIEDDTAFGLEILDFVIENSTFELTKDIIVIDPQTQVNEVDENTFFDISQIGLSASVLYVNDNFYKGADNLAIIKIKGKDLPAVLVPNKNISTRGDKFYAFDPPSVYNFKNINDLNTGNIYDLKIKESFVEKERADTDILYTGLELHRQASGGPSFNSLGEIVGILAFEEWGSEFANAPVRMLIIPNNIIQGTLNKVGVANEAGVYTVHFKQGIEYINSRHCDEASRKFETALSSRSTFTKNIIIDTYLVECYEASKLLEESKKGVSGFLNMAQEKIASLDLLDWIIIVLSAILVLTLLISFVVMIGKVRKKKEEPYKPSKNDRSEEMQKARRTSLSETLPKQAKEISTRPVGSDVAVLPADKVSPPIDPQKDVLKQRTVLKVKTDNKSTSSYISSLPDRQAGSARISESKASPSSDSRTLKSSKSDLFPIKIE